MHWDHMDGVAKWLLSPQGLLTLLLSTLWDTLRRSLPTRSAAGLIHDLGKIVCKVGFLIIAIGKITDKVLPQNLSPPPRAKW